MERNINCLRCNSSMEHIGDETIQLGESTWFLGNLSNLLSGALEVSIYCCPSCKKIEFFYLDSE